LAVQAVQPSPASSFEALSLSAISSPDPAAALAGLVAYVVRNPGAARVYVDRQAGDELLKILRAFGVQARLVPAAAYAYPCIVITKSRDTLTVTVYGLSGKLIGRRQVPARPLLDSLVSALEAGDGEQRASYEVVLGGSPQPPEAPPQGPPPRRGARSSSQTSQPSE